MADYQRQNAFYEFISSEPLRTKLLKYADEHGITGDTYGGDEKTRERFKLMEAYDRVAAKKVFRLLGIPWQDNSLEDTLDGSFFSGGTWIDCEIKARHYDYDLWQDWALEGYKVAELEEIDGWFLCIFPSSANPIEFYYALWDVNDTTKGSKPIWCKKSVAIEGTGDKNKDFPTFNINEARHRGFIGRKCSYDYKR